MRVCLINDSFPPMVDGVANVMFNYATILQRDYGGAVVVTPEYPGITDEYPFPVLRFPSANTVKFVGYRAGNPFSLKTVRRVGALNVDLVHAHCPIASLALARIIKDALNVPMVFTYHTKFDIEIKKAVKLGLLVDATKKILCENVASADEVWAVSRGAADNLRALGYEGDCVIMPNGVDMPRGRVSPERVKDAAARLSISRDMPIFLFAGRMMWYKGIRLIIDALARVKAQGRAFRMIFMGDGRDRAEIEEYAKKQGVWADCVFTGMLRDRELMREYFCLANLMLFPSTFDTNGLVVREAAACELPSVLIAGSCAAEDTVHGQNALTVSENADALAQEILARMDDPGALREIGKNALRDLYLSWDDAVTLAVNRYEELADRKRAGLLPARQTRLDLLFDATVEIADITARANREYAQITGSVDGFYGQVHKKLKRGKLRLRASEYAMARKMRVFRKKPKK